ncbi:chromate transporter [Mycoplasma elephantis]|uniref:chromate transporter n=1 Tax=Mycoplasma elephantis TaxID=114882 RepID=UPI00048740FB|nr:chromate transporter [Mycoplasma elephantis]
MISVILFSIGLLVFISLIVFGGGQVFMPLFQFYWNSLSNIFKIPISQELIDGAFAVANGTPGVLSVKFAFLSGYFIGQNQWYTFIIVLITYLSFVVPPIFLMYISMRLSKKYNKQGMFNVMLSKYFKPIVAAIMMALVVQIMMVSILPFLHFNSENFIFNQKYIYVQETQKSIFFSDYRKWILIPWCLFSFGYSFYLFKKNFPVFILILLNIIIAMMIFHPFV